MCDIFKWTIVFLPGDNHVNWLHTYNKVLSTQLITEIGHLKLTFRALAFRKNEIRNANIKNVHLETLYRDQFKLSTPNYLVIPLIECSITAFFIDMPPRLLSSSIKKPTPINIWTKGFSDNPFQSECILS